MNIQQLYEFCLSKKGVTEHFPFDVHYGYHFDSTLLGQFLRKKALALGVVHELGHGVAVKQHEPGDIASVQLAGDKQGGNYPVRLNQQGTVATGLTGSSVPFTCTKR